MLIRVFLLSLGLLSSFFYYDYQKISSNTHVQVEYAKTLKRINTILIGYEHLYSDDDTFKTFINYFWQSGVYSDLYFIYEEDGSGLFSDLAENPDLSPVDMRARPWYLASKLDSFNHVGELYENIFPPHDLMFTYSYPVIINDKLVGVGAYDLVLTTLYHGTLGLLSIQNMQVKDEHGCVSFSFGITSQNAIRIVSLYFFLVLLSLWFFKLFEYVLKFRSASRKDQLSGLKRRDSFKANRLDPRVKALCFFDIDHFKSINDTYGHDIGDEAIKAFANCLKENIRDTDVAFRWGGEEFLVLIRGKVDENIDVYRVLDRLRTSVEAMDIDGVPKFTVSIGYCNYDSNVDVKELIKQADLALYNSKRTGRNKVSEYKNRMSDELIDVKV